VTAIAATLRRLGEETGLDVEFRVQAGLDDDALAQPVAAHLVRIVQEALHNVRKHARARRVTVTVEADDAWLQVVVADDGAGLADPAAHRRHQRRRLRVALHARARRGRGRVARDRVRPRRGHAGDGPRATPRGGLRGGWRRSPPNTE
jgi:signal transduction histidine kinase